MSHHCEFFQIPELVPPHVYMDRGEKAWELIDERVVITLDQLRKKFGKITVNDYIWGGERTESGFRDKYCDHYRRYSQHSFGRAADCIFQDVTAEEVRRVILSTPNKFPFINAVELEVSWLHFDVRNCDRIKTFTP